MEMQRRAVLTGGHHFLYWECARDLWFPQTIEVTGPAPGIESPPDPGPAKQEYWVDATLELNAVGLEYELTSVRLYLRYDDSYIPGLRFHIDTEMYRSLRLLELRAGIGEDFGVASEKVPQGAGRKSMLEYDSDEEPIEPLLSVSHAYARGSVSGRRPQKDVSEAVGVSIATAGRWIRRAVEHNYLLWEPHNKGTMPLWVKGSEVGSEGFRPVGEVINDPEN